MAEKCVLGKTSTDFVLENKITLTKTHTLEESPLQWSANASVGFQYNVIQNLALYAEPELNYYFNNGSDINTIYKDKPLNFGLKVGVRIIIK